MSKSKFNKIYTDILDLINEENIEFMHPKLYSYNIETKFSQLLFALDNADIFTNDLKIINEDKNYYLIDIPEQLLDLVITNNHYIDLDKNIFKNSLIRSKHYANIKNKITKNVIISYFDWTNNNEIINFLNKMYGIENMPDDIEIEKFRSFLLSNKNNLGFTSTNTKEIFIFANIQQNSYLLYTTIYHELSHVIQKISGIYVVKPENTDVEYEFDDLEFSTSLIHYLFNNYEFPILVNELLSVFKKMQSKIYNKHYFLNIINQKRDINFENQFKLLNNNEIYPLYMYYCSKKFKSKLRYIQYKIKKYL